LREVARQRILVNVVEPGWVRTPLTESLPPAIRDAALAESLVGRYVEPADVAAAVNFSAGLGHSRLQGKSFASMGDSRSAVCERGAL